MSRKKPSVVRVAMAKRVAVTWLAKHAQPEFRITVYASGDSIQNLPSLLRAYRDCKTRLGSLQPMPDLGIEAGFDRVTLWSHDRQAMVELESWLRKKGCESTGIW